jgi:CheY-like chemotaxis protein
VSRPVLVVEDEHDLRESICDLLEYEGYGVAEAEHGREALQRMGVTRPGLILLDLMMPVMSGWELMDLMKRDRAMSEIPVIVVSASHDPPPGAVAFLPKPFEVAELLAIVERYAGEHRADRAPHADV